MRRVLMVAAAAALSMYAGAGAAAAQAAGAPSAASGGTWGTAREIAGALNAGGFAAVLSVSCKSAGNCSAGGFYADKSGSSQAFVVNEKNGAWGTARELAARLNVGGNAQVNSVSCASAGNCNAAGSYSSNSATEAFVVNEHNGAWGTVAEVRGIAGLNVGGDATVNSVSCASAGNCSAGGFYTSRTATQALVVSEVKGTWRTAQKVAPATSSARGDAQLLSVSCASAGTCSAGGFYTNKSGKEQAFVVNEVRGTWRGAQEVAGSLNPGAGALVKSVSCASAGNCSAGGFGTSKSGTPQAFVVNEKNGTWGAARKVAISGSAQINSVSCASAGNCSAGGTNITNSARRAFVVNEHNGTWGTGREVAGKLNAEVDSVSCASAGNCSAGGRSISGQAFVVNEQNGTWGAAEEVPGTAALNTGRNAAVDSVSCASPGKCSAGGDYTQKSGKHGKMQAFVVSET